MKYQNLGNKILHSLPLQELWDDEEGYSKQLEKPLSYYQNELVQKEIAIIRGELSRRGSFVLPREAFNG